MRVLATTAAVLVLVGLAPAAAGAAPPAPAITDRVAAGLCRTGSVVDYRTFPGLGHDTIPGVVTGIDDGAADQILAWVADRFAGRPAGSTCAERRNQP